MKTDFSLIVVNSSQFLVALRPSEVVHDINQGQKQQNSNDHDEPCSSPRRASSRRVELPKKQFSVKWFNKLAALVSPRPSREDLLRRFPLVFIVVPVSAPPNRAFPKQRPRLESSNVQHRVRRALGAEYFFLNVGPMEPG